MSEAAKKDKNILYFIIYCIIAALGWIIPPIEPITVGGMHVLFLFIAMVFGTSVTSSVWPSLVTILLLPFTGLINLSGVLTVGFGNDTFVYLIFMFVFIAFFEETGTTDVIVKYLLSRNFLKGHPYRVFLTVFLAAWLVCVLCGVFVGMYLLWQFAYKICDILGYKPHEKFSNILIYGVAIAGMCCMFVLPWKAPTIVMLNAYSSAFGNAVDYGHYLLYSLPIGFVGVLIYAVLCKVLYRVDISKLKELDVTTLVNAEDLTLKPVQKVALGAMVALIVIMLLPSLLPATNGLRIILDSMGLTMKGVLLILVLSLIRIDGQNVFNFKKLASKGMAWDVLLMLAAIFCFINLLSSADAGISAFLNGIFMPIFAGKSAVVLLLLVVFVTVLLTNFMNNMVVAAIMITAIVPIAEPMGLQSMQMAYLITVCANIALLLPPASAPSFILFSNTTWVKAKDVYIYCTPAIVLISLVALLWNVILFMF